MQNLNLKVTENEGFLRSKRFKRDVEYKYLQVPNSVGTVIAIGGTGGGFYGPANIYDDLALNLQNYGLSLLRINVYPDHMEGTINLIIGLEFLKKKNENQPILLMGWSMGGASIIQAAKFVQDNNMFTIKGLITLAGQSYGADPVQELKNIPIYIVHGTEDKCMGPRVAESIYRIANEPKELVLLEGASHWMAERYDTLRHNIYNWIVKSFYE